MSEVLLSPEILIIRNTQGGGTDIRGVASAHPHPVPPGVNQPGCTTMSTGKRPPGHQQMSRPWGQCARSPLVVLGSICTYMRAFSLQLIPAALPTVASSLQFVPETPEWPLLLQGTGLKIQPLNFPSDCFDI